MNIKIGIIADIHGNLDALHSCYEECRKRDVNYFIFLGDIIGIGPRPDGCIEFIQSIQDQIISIVRGNHEEYLIHEAPKYNHNDPTKGLLPQEILDLFDWTHNQISQKSANYIRQLPTEELIKIGHHKIYISHYPSQPNGQYAKFYLKPNLQECQEIFADKGAKIHLFGHTHLPCFEQDKRGHMYINPGSAGCPVGTDLAPLGILTLHNLKAEYQQINASYDPRPAIDIMRAMNDKLPAIDYTIHRFYTSEEFIKD